MYERYESPLSGRYASDDMQALFSERRKIETWRKLWVSLADAERACGLPIPEEAVQELRDHVTDIDFEAAKERESIVQHDVMAHIYAYGLKAPNAKPIIHLGATSAYVKDNADLIIYRDALLLIRKELLAVIRELASFSMRYAAVPTLGLTHYQPAQPVTVGKRFALYLQDFVSDLSFLGETIRGIRFLGCRGTTGTEASFMDLFKGDTEKIDEMNRRIANDFSFDSCWPIASQTYPRKCDSRILMALSSIGESAYRFAADVRLMQHDREISEQFGRDQVGSSAMPYKQNPMRSERICSLSRFLMNLSLNGSYNASSQWFERTLDDSANRRLSMSEAFLTADAVLALVRRVASGLVVHEAIIREHLCRYLPFIATENILMEAVKKGGDRQEIHEIIRKHSVEAVKETDEGRPNPLLKLLSEESAIGLSLDELNALLVPERYVGRSEEQVLDYLRSLEPILKES